MDGAELLDIGEHFSGAGPRRRARGREGIADQHNAGLAMSLRDVEIRGPDLDRTRDLDIAGQRAESRHQLKQALLRSVAHLAQPGIIHGAIDHQVGAHRRLDRKQREIGHPGRGILAVIGKGAEVEGARMARLEIESKRDRVACAGDDSFEPELMAQSDVQAVGEHDKARGHRLPIRQRNLLLVAAGRDIRRLRGDDVDARRHRGTHGVDQTVVEEAGLVAAASVDHVPQACDPDGLVVGHRRHQLLGKADPAQDVDLRTIQFFATKVRRVNRMRIDQRRANAGAAEQGGCCGAGQSSADNRDIRFPHLRPLAQMVASQCANE